LIGVSSTALFATGVARAEEQPSSQVLDPITVLATKTEERASDSLASVSTVRGAQLEQLMPSRVSEAFMGTPGVWFQERADDPGTAISIRGLQDFGRVAVVVDGARQNFQRTGHNADGVFYLEPELIGGADVVRGPVANIYGSGAIGGVVSFRTKDVEDILRPGQTWGVLTHGEIGSNIANGLGSAFAAARISPDAEVMAGATIRNQSNYRSGDGTEVPNTGSETWTGIGKLTFRPLDGHEVKLGFINYDSTFKSGQPYYGTTAPYTGLQLSSIFDTHVTNQVATGRWTYSKPEDRLFDFDGNVYWTRTSTDQTKIDGLPPAYGGIGKIGDQRNFTINTYGVDVHNTSRFDVLGWRHAVTYGADGFRDDVDTSGFGVVFTPSGERTVSGGFVQLKSNYDKWLEVISAARYDRYSLQGGGVSTDGDRISPKITVGVTPLAGITPYVTYAEGYRAPSVTETLVAGVHPVVFAPFEFLPNPALRPEVGKTKEAGLNLRFDNIFRQADAFRAKFNIFRNDVDDFIELTSVKSGQTGSGGYVCTVAIYGCQQYENIAAARLEGMEFESSYDAGDWFAGLAGSHVRGHNVQTGAPLGKVPPDSITTTVGTRLFDRKLTLTVRWQAVAAKKLDEIPVNSSGTPLYAPTDAYNLINLYAGYEFSPEVTTAFSIENLLNVNYTPYLSAYANPTGSGAPLTFPAPGITVKASLKVRFGDNFGKSG
jgi:hemoglobin/transferrin/lactoferrin receptor protein